MGTMRRSMLTGEVKRGGGGGGTSGEMGSPRSARRSEMVALHRAFASSSRSTSRTTCTPRRCHSLRSVP